MKSTKRTAIIGGGAAAVAAITATWTGLTMLPGTWAHAQGSVQPAGLVYTNSKSAVAVTPAMREAASMQTAFNEVARAAAPAVVTITTMEHVPTQPNPFGNGSPFRFFGPGAGGRGGRGGGGSDPFGGLFPGFGGPNGGDDGSGNIAPNAFEAPQAPGAGRQGGEVRAGLGSGFIVRNDGLILTNAHVVRGADTVTVKLSDGREFKNAKVVGQDEESDVAVVKIPATNLPTVTLGDSDDVNVGDWSIAVGNPYGLDHTVTVGVISAKGREVPNEARHSTGEFLQTDASINPGNSGGPLLNIYGRVVGINNSIFSESGGNVGIGFAVPIDTARKIADQLVRDGKVHRARLNMLVGDVSTEASAFGLDPNTKGALVSSVTPGGPAAKAGLQPGDVITGINGKPVTKTNELIATVSDTPAGRSVTLDVLRNGTHRTITATPQEMSSATGAKTAGSANGSGAAQDTGALGVRLAPLTADLAQQLGIDVNVHGVVVAGVVSGSPAEAAGIQRGDIIERVGQTPVSTPENVRDAVKSILSKQTTGDKSVALYVSHLVNGQRAEDYVLVNPQ